MAKFKSEDLLNELQEDVRRLVEVAQFFKQADKSKLVYQIDKDKWSVVQALEHLNAYSRFYLPVIEKVLSQKEDTPAAWFNSGYWGEKFTKSVKPTNVYEIKQKIRTMKKFRFPNSLNIETVLNEFNEHQEKLLQLLDRAREKDLTTNHIPVSFNKLIKLRLGDAFRFIVAHEQRHALQARNTLKATGVMTDKFPVILREG